MLTTAQGYTETSQYVPHNSSRTPKSLRSGHVVKKFRDWYMSISYVNLKSISQFEEDISRLNPNNKVNAVIICLKTQVKALSKAGLTVDEEKAYIQACNELENDQGSHGWILKNVGIYNAQRVQKRKDK